MRFHLDHDYLDTKYFCQIVLTVTIAVLNSILYSDESL